MKKILIFIILLISLTINVTASSGALKSHSIKTCPNGKMYGYHGSDNHWHEAEYTPRDKGSNYTAVGSPIYSDPCPIKYEEPTTTTTSTTKKVTTNTTTTTQKQTTTTTISTTSATATTTTVTTTSPTTTTSSLLITTTTTATTSKRIALKNNIIKEEEAKKDSDPQNLFIGLLTIAMGGSAALLYKIKKK